jgi:hypothetical protein
MPGSSPGMTSVFCVHANLNFKQQPLFADTPPRSRRMSCARFGLLVSPSAIRGRRECRAPDAPESRVCRGSGRTHTRNQVTPESPGIPRAMVYGLYRALPGDRLSCHRRRRSCLHRLDTSVGVSGPHVFAVRLRYPRQEHLPRPPHPSPALVTLRNAPLSGTGRRTYRTDLGLRKIRIFLQKGLDTNCRREPVGQISTQGFSRKARRPRKDGGLRCR